MKEIQGNIFLGNKVSEHGLERNRVDYATLAKAVGSMVHGDYLIQNSRIDMWELYNGTDYVEEDDEYIEIFQYYIITEQGAEVLAQ